MTAEDDFSAFVVAQLPGLLRFGNLLTGDRASAEDLVQTALARTHLRWKHLREPAAATAYVRTAMVRQQSNLRSRLLARERPVAALPERSDVAAPYADLDERDAMWSALARLGARQRAVLVLRYYERLSEAEIGAVLACSPRRRGADRRGGDRDGRDRARRSARSGRPASHPEGVREFPAVTDGRDRCHHAGELCA